MSYQNRKDRWQIVGSIATVVGAIAALMVVPEVSRCWRSRSTEARSVPVPSKTADVISDVEKAPLPLRNASLPPTATTTTITSSAAPATALAQTQHGYTITLRKINSAPSQEAIAIFEIVNRNQKDHRLAFDCTEGFLVDEGGNTHKADECSVAGSRTGGSSGQLLVSGITYPGRVSYYGYGALHGENVVPILRLQCFDATDNAGFLLEFRNMPIEAGGR